MWIGLPVKYIDGWDLCKVGKLGHVVIGAFAFPLSTCPTT